jgi:hypothetical protein
MPLLSDAAEVYLGATEVDALYVGAEQVWPAPILGVLAGTAPLPVGALTATATAAGVLAGATPRPVGTLSDDPVVYGVLAGTAPLPVGALTATATAAGVLAGTTPRPVGALTADLVGIDATNVAFTGASLTGEYHIWAAGLPADGTAGLVVHLHGDDAYEHARPTDNYAFGGNRGGPAVANAKGYAFVSAKAPDATGTITWWENGVGNANYLAALLDELIATHDLDRGNVWLVGYSGGAEFITEHFVPLHGKAKITGGGAVIIGGGSAAVSTPVGWDSTFKAAFPMHWVTGGQDDGTYADDSFDALAAATAGEAYYDGQGFTTTLTTPAGIGHEIDGAFGPILDDILPTLSGHAPPSRTPGTTRPELVTSYLVVANANNTSTTTTTSFTPDPGEVIVVKAFNADLDSPNIATVTGGDLTYATKIHIQGTDKSEAWIFVAEVGAESPGSMTVSVTWWGTAGRHGIVVERWDSGLVEGVPAQGATIMGTGAPSSALTPESADSVLTWICVDWDVVAGTATYRSSATQTQQSSMSTVRAYAAYQDTPTTSAQTIGLTAPTGQNWSMGGIELLPAPD